MDFWRVLRVISARRWIILAFVLLAAGSVFVATTFQSQKKLYEAEALLEPQDLPLAQVLSTNSGPDGQSAQVAGANSATAAAERTSRVSDLVMLLRSSNDLYLKAARLLRQDEKDRAKEVEAILTRNGYFATYDANIATQAASIVTARQLLPSQKQEYITNQRALLRKQVLDSLAKASDSQGSFAPTGVPDTDAQIAAKIAGAMKFDTVAGPLNTEAAPQIVNQIRVTGNFGREAEANLYVNMLCVAFIDFYTTRSAAGVNAKIALLNSKLEQAETKLNTQRKVLAQFRLQKGVVATAQQDQIVAQVTRAQDLYNQAVQELQDADGQVLSLQQSLLTARSTVATQLPSSQNPQVALLNSQIAGLKIQLGQLQAKGYLENYPEVLPIRAQLQEAQRQLALEISRPFVTTQVSENPSTIQALLNQARARRDGLQRRLTVLTTQLGTLNQQVAELPQVQNRLNELNRGIQVAERNVQEIDTSLSRYELLAVDNGRAGTVSIISQANARLVGGDIAGQRGKLALLAGILAALLCVAGVIIFDALDPSVRTSQDAERLFGLPVEGVIPEQTPDPMLAAWVTYRSPDSPVAEAYRLLRTRLLFTAAEHPFQSLVMVTGRPGQGSTTTAANLAITLAQDGKRVILVDANLRDPQLHSLFHSSNEVGLTTLLTVNLRLEDVVRPTAITNMELLPAGPMPLNPSELLGSPRMRYIHHELKKRADFILFDTPSVIAFSDAAILSSYVDATLLVVRANNVPRESEKQVRSLLEKARANLIGMVFNAVPADRVDAVGYHAHYYAASRRSDDSPGTGPGGGFGQAGGNPGFGGDVTPGSDSLSLALLGDGGAGDGTVRPVSPFTPTSADAGVLPTQTETAPSPPAARGTVSKSGAYQNGSQGNGHNGNGNTPTALLSEESASKGAATLVRPSPLHGNDEVGEVPDGEPFDSSSGIKPEGLDGIAGLDDVSPYDNDTQRLVEGDFAPTDLEPGAEKVAGAYKAPPVALFLAPEPLAFREDPAATDVLDDAVEPDTGVSAASATSAKEPERAASVTEAEDAKTMDLVPVVMPQAEPDNKEFFAPPVDPHSFSSAATHTTAQNPGVPPTILATLHPASFGNTTASAVELRASTMQTGARVKPGTWLILGAVLIGSAGVGILALAIGGQINVR